MITPIAQRRAGKVYPAIQSVFSRFWGEARDMTPTEWMEQIKRPIAAGYRMETVRVVVKPPQAIAKKSFEASQTLMPALLGSSPVCSFVAVGTRRSVKLP